MYSDMVGTDLTNFTGDVSGQINVQQKAGKDRIYTGDNWICFLLNVDFMIQDIDKELTVMAKEMGIQRSQVIPVSTSLDFIAHLAISNETSVSEGKPLQEYDGIQPLALSRDYIEGSTTFTSQLHEADRIGHANHRRHVPKARTFHHMSEWPKKQTAWSMFNLEPIQTSSVPTHHDSISPFPEEQQYFRCKGQGLNAERKVAQVGRKPSKRHASLSGLMDMPSGMKPFRVRWNRLFKQPTMYGERNDGTP